MAGPQQPRLGARAFPLPRGLVEGWDGQWGPGEAVVADKELLSHRPHPPHSWEAAQEVSGLVAW